MADDTYERSETSPAGHDQTRRTGWTALAGVMVIAGGVEALDALIAVVNDEWVVRTNRAISRFDLDGLLP